jgi:uncharacterized membrane protein YqiK
MISAFVLAAAVFIFILLLMYIALVSIREDQVGIVVKKFGTSDLPPGKLVALHGEAGYQADTLAPGWHLGYWPWQYRVEKVPMMVIPQGEIGLVVANDGQAIPPERILGKITDCDHFQDAKRFLQNGGEKGRQAGILTAGTYRINLALFQVITAENSTKHGMMPQQLHVYQVATDQVGIVTTLDGHPIAKGEIAARNVEGHNNFQNIKDFMAVDGQRGLQEQILLSGSWNLNPWFARVEQVPMTEVPIGHVGVVISYVGEAHVDVSGAAFKHGDLVQEGHKGVWVTPLLPGKHPVNTRVMKVDLVPTTNIVLNWANRTESHKWDQNLSSITVRSKDGFAFNLDVAQIIHVAATEAPKVISRVGNMQNLVDHVLEPTIGNYFRNSAQDHTVLDFLADRSERQKAAAEHIREGLAAYDVEAIDTLIGDITPPASLMQTQTDRKIADEQKRTYEIQEAAQKQRQLLVRETAMADIQNDIVKSEQGVRISEMEAAQAVKKAGGEAEAVKLRALGEAEALRQVGFAKAETYNVGVQSLGGANYTLLQLMQMIAEKNVRITPDVLVAGEKGGTLLDAFIGQMARNKEEAKAPVTAGSVQAGPSAGAN